MAKEIRLKHVFLRFFLIVLLVLLDICPVVQTTVLQNSVEFFKRSNFLVGICDNAVQSGKKSPCIYDMERILNGVREKEMWAVKLIDAFGNIPSPFTWGDNFWYSPIIACDSLRYPLKVSLSSRYDRFTDPFFMNSTSPIDLEFRMIYANFTSPYQLELKLQIAQILHIGLCIPRSCSGKDITEFTAKFFRSNTLEFQKLLNITLIPIGTKVPQFDLMIFKNPSTIIFGILVITLVMLAIYARIEKDSTEDHETSAKFKSSNFQKFVSCFNVVENLKFLYTIETNPQFIKSLAGMRTLTCFWVISLHVIWHPMFTFDNSLQLVTAMDEAISQAIHQAFFYVDAFFVISAFLLTFNFLKSKKRIDEIKSNSVGSNAKIYSKMVARRYLRIAPVFMLTVLVSDLVYSILDASTPFYVNPTSDLYCKKTWWYNLFLLNNIQTMNEMCVSWGWYLACEMQYFLIFLAILFIYSKHQKTGKSIYIAIAVMSLAISYYCYFWNGITFQYDVIYNTSGNLYARPWTRMNSYIAGSFMGWLMHEIFINTVKMKSINAKSYWIGCITFYICSIFVTYFKNTPIWMVALFQTVGRVVLGIFIGSLVIMCEIGCGGYFNRFISSKFLVGINKLTYSMYMLAPIVITVLFGAQRNSTHFDQVAIVMDTVAVIFATYIVAILAAIFVELPFIKISGKFIKL